MVTPHEFKARMVALLPRLRRYALTLTRSPSDADDLLQETCTQALSKWDRYDSSQPLDRWAFTVMRNTWISEQRKRKVRQGAGQMQIEDAHDLSDNKDADETLFAHQIGGLVMSLPSELSQTLLLVAKEGFTYKEAAQAMDIPVGTVMSRIHRARKIISETLTPREEII